MHYFIYHMSKLKLNKIAFLSFFYFLINSVSGQLAVKLDSLLQNEYLQNAEIGISVIGEGGQKLFSLNEDKNLIPASLMKIITNFASLEHLGKEYKYETKISYTGEILPDGNLTGDIVIYGNGDPSLASERYQKRPQLSEVIDDIYKFIAKAGITCIDGNIICDASYFGTDGTIHSWSWNDIGNYYAANTWSINIHENYYNLYFQLQPELDNPPKILRATPKIPGLYFINELKSRPRGSGDQSYIFGSPYTYKRYVRGSLPVGPGNFKIKGSIPDAPYYLAQLIAHKLEISNISNSGPETAYSERVHTDTEIGKFSSPVLSDLVTSANLESINLFCESFLVSIGGGNRKKGIKRVNQFLFLNGIDTSDINIEDGSGLSFWNNISAEDFAILIGGLHDQYGKSLEAYFPEAGVSGTLSYLFRNSEAKGRLWAKTGSMQQVMNYAGFTKAKSGRNISFCIMINRHKVSNRKVRRIEEKLMEAIYLFG